VLSCDSDGDDAVEVEGCTDANACNFNADATIEDNSCEQLDCNGECGGSAEYDECGICGGDDLDDIGYHCGDIQVLQDIMDLNNISGNPIDIGYSQEWNEDGRLTSLNFYQTELDDGVPESIGDLTELTYLNFAFCNLSSIPTSIGNLTNLQTLALGNNDLTELPDEIGNLINLDTLVLQDNNLQSVPESLANLTNLSSLDLQSNNLVTIPDGLASLNLNWFSLYNNYLTSLPSGFDNNCPSTFYVENNNLCEEYHYDCISNWGTQDQSTCP
jgi:Leucine-rich repeat (LRR) protein